MQKKGFLKRLKKLVLLGLKNVEISLSSRRARLRLACRPQNCSQNRLALNAADELVEPLVSLVALESQ